MLTATIIGTSFGTGSDALMTLLAGSLNTAQNTITEFLTVLMNQLTMTFVGMFG